MGLLELVRERHRDTNMGKLIRKQLKEVAAHYRQEYERMQQERAKGVTGRLEVEAYA